MYTSTMNFSCCQLASTRWACAIATMWLTGWWQFGPFDVCYIWVIFFTGHLTKCLWLSHICPDSWPIGSGHVFIPDHYSLCLWVWEKYGCGRGFIAIRSYIIRLHPSLETSSEVGKEQDCRLLLLFIMFKSILYPPSTFYFSHQSVGMDNQPHHGRRSGVCEQFIVLVRTWTLNRTIGLDNENVLEHWQDATLCQCSLSWTM